MTGGLAAGIPRHLAHEMCQTVENSLMKVQLTVLSALKADSTLRMA